MTNRPTAGASERGRFTDAIVVGGGLTGLACAHDLRERGLSVHLLEAGPRVGGVVGTLEVGGFLFESGPNTVPASAKHVRTAAGRLGVADQLITSRPEAKRRFLFQNGGLYALPSGPQGLFTTPLLSLRGRLRAATEFFRRFTAPAGGATPSPEPTFEEFLSERIGPEATRTFAGAFVRGIYAAEIEELGAASAFPRLWDMASEHGGIVRGMMARGRAARRARRAGAELPPGPRTSPTDLLSFTGGYSVLVDAYDRALEDCV